MSNNHLKIKIPKMGLWILIIFQPLPSALTVFSISLLVNFILSVAQANTCELSLISLFTLHPNQEIWSLLSSKYIKNPITPHFLIYPLIPFKFFSTQKSECFSYLFERKRALRILYEALHH